MIKLLAPRLGPRTWEINDSSGKMIEPNKGKSIERKRADRAFRQTVTETPLTTKTELQPSLDRARATISLR